MGDVRIGPLSARQYMALVVAASLLASILIGVWAAKVEAQREKYFFTIHLMVPKGNVNRENVGRLLVEELAKIGIKVELHIIDFSEWLQRAYNWPKTWEEGGYDMFLVQLGYGIDPNGMYIFFHSDSIYPNGLNIMGYMNPKVDELLEKGAKELDPEERKKAYMNVSKYLYEDLPVIPYWRVVQTFILRKDVEGFNPITDTDTCYNWYAPGGDTIKYVQPTDADNLLPIFMATGYSYRAVGYPCFDGLVRINENYEVVPAIAESWEWVNDTFIVFHLRKDVYWHDGVQLTAHDVKFTFDAILDPETGAVMHSTAARAIEEVVVIDDFTVAFKLKEPFAPFLSDIAIHEIAPKHILEGVPHSEWRNHWMNTGVDEAGNPRKIIGCGPYKFVEWKKDEYIKLEAFDKYYLGPPKTKILYMMVIPDAATAYAAIEKGEVDILNDWFGWTPKDIEAAKANPDLKIAQYSILGPQLVGINLAHPTLQNRYVRWAINYMIPRDHIINNLLGGVCGKPAYQFLAPETLGHNPDLPPVPYDPEKAKEMMEKAGYRFEWLEEKPLPAWVYVAPIATFAIGLAIGAAVMRVVARRAAEEAAEAAPAEEERRS